MESHGQHEGSQKDPRSEQLSRDARELNRRLRDYVESGGDLASIRLPGDEAGGKAMDGRFHRLADEWRQDTLFLSSTTQTAMHPAYQAIIGMGPAALPVILRELRDKGGHWYWALKSIAQADPVPADDRGDIEKMKSAWLEWGRARGYID